MLPPSAIALDDFDEIEIKGESHYQDALIAIFGKYNSDGIDQHCVAELVRDPKNKHDKNAIRCEISGELIGYVAREQAEELADAMKAMNVSKLQVVAHVRGGWSRGKSDSGMYGVVVEIPPDVLKNEQ